MFYGAFLKLCDKTCIVIGGGSVATRKVRQLCPSGAMVTIISPTLSPTLSAWAQEGKIHHISRPFQTGDLANATLVYAATDDRTVNAAVQKEAKHAGIWCNIADDPAACDFFTPATLEHRGVQIAISTSGVAPAAAKALKEALAADLSDGGRRFYDYLLGIDALLDRPRPKQLREDGTV